MTFFDFNKLNRPTPGSRDVNPLEIFRKAPALSGTPNDLWQGQSKALEAWHQNRTNNDVLISLHTGAGKTIVGLLAAQSLVHEGRSKVLYLCATNDLVLQTSREITEKLGFPHTTRMAGAFSNNLYAIGEGFCLTNYQALFNSRTAFARDLRPNAIIFDDAHVAEKIIRDSFTVRIDKERLPSIYSRIVSLLKPHFLTLHREEYFDRIIAGDSVYSVAAAPPSAVIALDRDRSLIAALREAEAADRAIGFSLGHLADRLDRCAIFLSKNSIEICPPFLPSRRVAFLTDPDIRRIYLSATLTSEVDFCRAFGKRPSVRIEPESDAGIGERLIVAVDAKKLNLGGIKNVSPEVVARILAQAQKLLISTPSYAAADKFKSLAVPPRVDEFSAKLDEFRRSSAPAVFILVGRVDGIDLPHATCRVMLADGLPTGFSLSEIYLYDFIEMRNSFAAKLSNRIAQMFGRTNRGRNDYSVIFVINEKFVNWLSTPRNIALLPELLRKQLLLGRSLVDQFGIDDVNSFAGLAHQVISRDPGWLSYYKDSIGGLDVSEDQKEMAAETDALLTEAALAESEFMAQMWDGVPGKAREVIGEVVDKVVLADRKLAGWYNVQIGHTLEMQGDSEAAAKQYSQARARIHQILALPFPSSSVSLSKEQAPRNLLHRRLLEIFENDIRIQNDRINRYDRMIAPLFDPSASANQHEEAMRSFGELLGFEASRPEQEKDNESTLDVLWNSADSREAILLELKTKKYDKGINMADVGQGFNHYQASRTALNGSKLLGLIFVCPNKTCSREAAPSAEMWVSDLAAFKKFYDETSQMLLAVQRLEPRQRFVEIEALSQRPEWQPIAIFERLKGTRLLDLK
jgi:hypothetical protein